MLTFCLDLCNVIPLQGCQINQELGFRCASSPTRPLPRITHTELTQTNVSIDLQSAAELVVIDLDQHGRAKSKNVGANASKNELMLALYELGTSFRFGWGVEKDKKMVRPSVL